MTTSIQIIVPVSSYVSGQLGFVNLTKFTIYLNRWRKYLKRYHTIFSPYYQINLNIKRSRRRYFYFGIIPLFTIGWILSYCMSRTFVMQYGSFTELLVTTIWVEAMLIIRIYHNVKDCFNFTVLRLVYRELRYGIEAQYETLKDKIRPAHVRKWLRMVTFIRDQKFLVEEHMKFQNLWLFLEIFVISLLVLTAGMLVFLKEQISREYSTVVTWYFSFAASCISLLFLKSHMAELITEEVYNNLLINYVLWCTCELIANF